MGCELLKCGSLTAASLLNHFGIVKPWTLHQGFILGHRQVGVSRCVPIIVQLYRPICDACPGGFPPSDLASSAWKRRCQSAGPPPNLQGRASREKFPSLTYWPPLTWPRRRFPHTKSLCAHVCTFCGIRRRDAEARPMVVSRTHTAPLTVTCN